MFRHVFLAGLALWLIGTLYFRFAPNLLPSPSLARTIPFYAVNAVAALIVSRLLMRWIGVPAEARPAAASLFILPTLILDALATAFFARVFPNLPTTAAPMFGGLMLVSAAGAVVGAWLPR